MRSLLQQLENYGRFNQATVTESEPLLLVFLTTHSQAVTEEDIPGASLNGFKPNDLHVMELKCWLKCRGATTSGKKQDPFNATVII